MQLPPALPGACPAPAGAVRAQQLELSDVDCTERYSSTVRCGGQTFLFSRIEHFPPSPPPNSEPDPVWQSTARTGINRNTTGLARGPGQQQQKKATKRDADGRFRTSVLALRPDAAFHLANNAAYLCREGEFVLYGGGDSGSGIAMSSAPSRSRGIALSGADIAWSTPAKIIGSAQRETGCVENRGRECEYDGKLSATFFRRRIHLFSRSNLNSKGGRHVQLSTSANGRDGWSRWSQIRIDGYTTKPQNNIYFLAARRVLAGSCPMLLATFPASIEGRGGLYASVSRDGLRWGAPARVLNSTVLASWRTRDHPIDGEPVMRPSLGGGGMVIGVQHRVAVPADEETSARPVVRAQEYCQTASPPLYCEYEFRWSVARHNESHLSVQLGAFEPWAVSCAGAG